MVVIHGECVYGTDVDSQTRCFHYRSDLDIIAIKFKCCGRWFPCFECHKDATDHAAQVWSRFELGEKAVLCGNCGYQLTINEYLSCDSECLSCKAGFNPGCSNHYHLYFDAG